MEKEKFEVGKVTETDHAFEEVIYLGFDKGWDCNMPVKLITYKKSGTMDLHRQTGENFVDHLYEAELILAKRGLYVDKRDRALGSTGMYMLVRKLPPMEKDDV